MAKPGHVYVLINTSMDGYVKIGKTSRSPKERAKELSSSSGVPTPFIVAYEAYFNDCDAAEKKIHYLLEERGVRTSDNREFFEIQVHDAVDLIYKLRFQEPNNGAKANHDYDQITKEPVLGGKAEKDDIGKELYDTACSYHLGINGFLQDDEHAYALFKKAACFGYHEALIRLGDMHKYGRGVKKDLYAALLFYKKAMEHDVLSGYVYSAITYLEIGHLANSEKCIKKLISSMSFKTHPRSPSLLYLSVSIYDFLKEYMCCTEKIPSYFDELSLIKPQLLLVSKSNFKRGFFENEDLGVFIKNLPDSKTSKLP